MRTSKEGSALKGLKHSAAALGLVLVTAGVALASEGGGEHHADWGNFAFRVANFVIFIGIIYWAAGKKIVGFFSGRRKGIEQELNDLESRKAEAAKNLADVERRIANLEQERQSILAEYRAQGEAMAGRHHREGGKDRLPDHRAGRAHGRGTRSSRPWRPCAPRWPTRSLPPPKRCFRKSSLVRSTRSSSTNT
uniref:F1F0-ATPase b subunit n=1 Tax=Nitratidesulfovibrio vulgaris TaxID=881 RepID=Q9S5B9_NITVL|nr:F1F0-ATPase b subunit [Desulfovibrio vulgaris] [Nitratidesulfovibrio vulgaris str. 'Miyazaki F']